MPPQTALRPLQPGLREGADFTLPAEFSIIPLLQEAERREIKTFSGWVAVAQRQIEQRNGGVVDLIGVRGHRETRCAA